MRHLIGLLIAALVIGIVGAASAAAPAAAATNNAAATRNRLIAKFEPVVEPYEQIFPAFEIASQGLNAARVRPDSSVFGQADALIGAQVRVTQAKLALTLEISADGLLAPSRITAELPKAGKSYMLYPELNWLPGALERVQKARSVVIHFRLFRGDSMS